MNSIGVVRISAKLICMSKSPLSKSHLNPTDSSPPVKKTPSLKEGGERPFDEREEHPYTESNFKSYYLR